MGPYLGDYKRNSKVYFLWDINDKSGASVNRPSGGKGTIQVYKDQNWVECTAGIVDDDGLDIGYDLIAGLNGCIVDLSADEFYAPGHDYSVVLKGATIDSETVNAVLACFSIENRYPGSSMFAKAAKVVLNKAVQDKLTGKIDYYDDDNETVLLTHTPQEDESEITRNPS